LAPENRDLGEPLLAPMDEANVAYDGVTRCLKYIQSWREHLAHAWVDQVRGTPDTRVIGHAVNDLLSLALLVEKARRTSPGSVPPLREA